MAVRYHLQLYKEWKANNQIVKLLQVENTTSDSSTSARDLAVAPFDSGSGTLSVVSHGGR